MHPTHRFVDRSDAGRQLASALREYAGRDDVIVIALPRGGVVVGYEVAKALRCALDVLIVRKLGVPGHEELALGAIASNGVRVLNEDVLRFVTLTREQLKQVVDRERHELARRELAYRGDRLPLNVKNRTVLLVDDGLATGATMQAAISAVRQLGARRTVVAVPIGAHQTCERIKQDADQVVCIVEPDYLIAISLWYQDFAETTDENVKELLNVSEPAALYDIPISRLRRSESNSKHRAR